MPEYRRKQIREWLNDEERSFETGYSEGEYTIAAGDIEEFCGFMSDDVDLIHVNVHLNKDGIWFFEGDLDRAKYY